MSDNGKRWTVSTEGDRLYDGDSVIRAEVYGPDELTADIAARLNGPSPAEVAALLREVQRDPESGRCVYCRIRAAEGGCLDDCKLDAMIKQCEGA